MSGEGSKNKLEHAPRPAFYAMFLEWCRVYEDLFNNLEFFEKHVFCFAKNELNKKIINGQSI